MDWTCGIHRLPAAIEGDPPKALAAILWLQGPLVRSIDIYEEPDDPLQHLAESLEKAMQTPMAGLPIAFPSRVRVASEPLARALERLGIPGLRVQVAPTPEVDDAIESLTDFLSEPMLSPQEALDEIDEPLRGELMRAAGELLQLHPWSHCPPDAPIGVRIDSLGIDDGVVSVIGQRGESHGFLLFRTPDDYRTFTALSDLPDPDTSLLPLFYSLSYELTEPRAPGDPDSILPVPASFEPGLQRVPSPSELRALIATATALARFFRRRARDPALLAAWYGAKCVKGHYRIDIAGERHEVRIRAPSASAV